LLETALDQFTAGTVPTPLRHMLQVVKHFSRPRFLGIVLDPHLRQALVRRQLAGRAAEILALHTGGDTFPLERINPQRGNGKVWGLGQFLHRHWSIRGIQCEVDLYQSSQSQGR